MIGFAWLALRQAQEALKNGRLEEAHRLLCQPAANGHKRSWELRQQVAQGFVERGEGHLRHEDAAAAWNDLIAAEQVGVNGSAAGCLRQALTRLGLAEIRSLLEAGEPQRAAEAITQLRDRSVSQPELQVLDEAAKNWVLAREQAGRGEFSQALQTMSRVRRLLPGTIEALEQTITTLEHGHQSFATLLVNSRPAEKVLLQSGDRITLGGSCQLQFRQPVPVSASARLDLASGHRLPLTVDGVLLMADTLVLGPGSQVHVAMPDLKEPIVLFRQKNGLGVRYGGSLCVDGQRCRERGQLRPSSAVTGDDFAFAIEPVGTGTGRM